MITREMLAEAMNEIDLVLIDEHIKKISPPKVAVRYAVSAIIYAAACIAVMIALPFLIKNGIEPSVTPPPSVSAVTDDFETTEPTEEDVITYDSWEEAMEGEYKEALFDLAGLCGYIHEPYKLGDDIADIRVLDRCFLYALKRSFDYPSLKIDEQEQTVSISEAELDSICKALFGDHVSIRDYDRFLYAYADDYRVAADQAASSGEWGTIGNSARYLQNGVYTYGYATDHWGECAYSIDNDVPPVIRPMDGGFAVTIELLYSRTLGESESAGTATYTFVPTTDCSGKERYTLVSVDSGIECTHTVQCVINEAMMGFDPSNSIIPLSDGNMFTMAVDEGLVSVDGEWQNFMSWNSEAKCYVRTLEFVNAYRVDAGFVMDHTIHQKAYIGGTQPTFDGVEPIIGTNKNGVDYVMYLAYTDGGFISYTYYRVAPVIIVGFSYGGADEDKNTVLRWCDSICPMEY